MALPERIEPLCELLLGAAYADSEFKDREAEEVRGLLEDLGGPLSAAIETRIETFDPKTFSLAKSAAAFKDDPEDDKKRVLFLVAAINDSDDEVDFAEDEYLRALAKELGLPDSALAGMTVDIESEDGGDGEFDVDLQDAFEQVVSKKPPPPPPIPKK